MLKVAVITLEIILSVNGQTRTWSETQSIYTDKDCDEHAKIYAANSLSNLKDALEVSRISYEIQEYVYKIERCD